ncbi:MAG TPA: PAS domain S-box protein [Polyangia bacterium]|nr:PAS domain S-box protein [Polyangia bacterium]
MPPAPPAPPSLEADRSRPSTPPIPTDPGDALLFHELGTHMREAFWLRDARTQAILYVSPSFATVFSRPCETLYQGPEALLALIHPEDRERLATARARVDTAYEEEYRVVRDDGSFGWILGRGFPVRGPEGEVRHILELCEDITPWRRTEDDLRTTNDIMRALIQASPVAILALNLEHRVVLWNSAAERMFGWSAIEVLGHVHPIVSAEEQDDFRGLFQSVLEGGGFTGVETRRRRRDGTFIEVSISTAPMRDPDGQVVAAMALLEDITERKRSERALAEELARRAALAAENARLYQQAQDAVRLRDEFLSIASHELRTPCTSVRLAIQSLLRLHRASAAGSAANATAPAGPASPVRTGGAIPPEFLTQALEVASRQTTHLSNLIDQLLDVTRITAGRLTLHLADVDLSKLVREVVTDFRGELERSGTPLTLEVTDEIRGRWDASRLEQVMINLLSNAIKYGAGKPIAVRATREGDRARVTVRDHGIGIPPDRQHIIFERFGRAVSGRHYGGLGLGLYIVRCILDELGGTIQVESTLGAGSTFTIELPCAGPPPRTEDEAT